MKKLKSLSKHNSETGTLNYTVSSGSFITSKTTNIGCPCKNGIACPECGKELYDTKPNEILTSDPAQKETNCDCGYNGYRYV
jgi:hypothetical protein